MNMQAGSTLTRASKIDPTKTALLVVDLQNAEVTDFVRKKQPDYVDRIYKEVIPNVQRLLSAARASGSEVIYTTIESLTKDGRDRSLDHKLSNLHVAKGSWEGKVIAEVAPTGDEIVLPKTSSGVFNSTTIDYVLRNLGIESIIVVGVLTDQCVDMAVRDGADRGYFMICASDACTTYTAERHESALRAFGGYCRSSTTEALIEELTLPQKQ